MILLKGLKNTTEKTVRRKNCLKLTTYIDISSLLQSTTSKQSIKYFIISLEILTILAIISKIMMSCY